MASAFNVSTRTEEGYAVIETDGYLNGPTGEKLAETAKDLMNQGYNTLVINLEKTRLVNSIGISILIEIIEYLQEHGGSVHFCHLTPVIERTFKMMGLAQHAELHADEASATANL